MNGSRSLLADRDGPVQVLTINRPERGNALDLATVEQMLRLIEGLTAEPGDVRAVLLRSEGRHFCTGADIGGPAPDGGRPAIGHMVRALGAGPHRLIEAVWRCPLPVVAELKGRTSGMGLHLALAADFTVAAASATVAEPFCERGFNVDSGGSWLLPRFIGLTRAKQLLYTGEPLDAATARRWGLITEVVDDDDAPAQAAALARRLAAGATFAIGVTKQLLHRHLVTDLDDALLGEAAAIELTIRSDDFKEGMRAFAEKRRPTFTGH